MSGPVECHVDEATKNVGVERVSRLRFREPAQHLRVTYRAPTNCFCSSTCVSITTIWQS
jgi:hypothetical protein